MGAPTEITESVVTQMPERVIFVTSRIGPEMGQKLLDHVYADVSRGWTEITLAMSSPGGDLITGFMLHGVINDLGAKGIKVTAHNIGFVDSSALLIYLSASERLANPHSSFLMHGCTQCVCDGWLDVHACRRMMQDLERLNECVANTLADIPQLEIPESEITDCFNTGRLITATEAKDWKIAHETTPFTMGLGARVSMV